MLPPRFVLAAFCACATTPMAAAGTIRHDVADSQYLALAAEPEYASVGRISSSGLLASGTLIASDWVLTAAHVVDAVSSGTLSFTLGSSSYTSTEWIVNPGWNGATGGGSDLALVHLSQSVVGVTPATLYDNSDEVNMVGTTVGYGATGTGLTGAVGASGTKRAGENLIGGLGSVFGYPDTVLMADFDAPGSTSTDPKAISYPLEYLPAPGDSGGGLFVDVGGQTYLAGVTSFLLAVSDGMADASYGDAVGWTRVSSFYNWIDSIVPLVSTPIAGDLNFDGVVDIFDVAIVSNHWGATGAVGSVTGDANLDGVVDIFDVAFISNHWSASGAASVPEPTSGGLALAGAGLLTAVGASAGVRRRCPIASQRRVRRRQSAAASIRT